MKEILFIIIYRSKDEEVRRGKEQRGINSHQKGDWRIQTAGIISMS